MAEMMLGFECPHGFVDHYADCEKVNKPECVKCRDKAKLISQTMNGCFIGKWISVKDRLPEEKINPVTMDFQNVICFCDFGGDPRITDVRVYGYGTPIGHKETHFWHGAKNMDGVVTHWMPLPEPPKEG